MSDDDDRHLTGTWRVLGELLDERFHQIDTGRADHDDRRGVNEWGWLLLRRVSDLCIPTELATAFPTEDARRLFVEVAAIAVSAIEALDRRPDAQTPPGALHRGALSSPVDQIR